MRHSRRSLLLVAVLVVAQPASVRAAGPGESPAVNQAREHYKAGERAFNAGEFERARSEFEAGYTLVPRPGFLLNMAHSERRLGHLRNARSLYKRYLLADPESKQRDEVLGFISKLDSAIADEEKGASEVKPAMAATAPEEVASPATVTPPSPPPRLTAPPPASAVELGSSGTAPEPASTGKPFYARWWFWGVVVTVAAAATAGAILATRGSPDFHDDGSLGHLGGP